MDVHYLPTFEKRRERLEEVFDFLGDTDPESVSPKLREPLLALQRRADARRAPYDADIEEELAMWQDFLEIREDIHKFMGYRRFLWRLREADTKNFLATYLSGRSWAREWLPNGGVPYNACEQCNHWLPSRQQECECQFICQPLWWILEDYHLERDRFNVWLRNATMSMGIADKPQPPSPVDDFFVRVANYSLEHDTPGESWDVRDIYEVLLQTDSHARGEQVTCRDFLQMGLDYTLNRINWDQMSVLSRVHGILSDAEAQELVEAIHCDGLMYYISSFYLDIDGRYVDQQPRQWVINYLDANPAPRDIYNGVPFGRILTPSYLWNVYFIDGDGNVTVFCQFKETGDEWIKYWLGTGRPLDRENVAALWEDAAIFIRHHHHQPHLNVGHHHAPRYDPVFDRAYDPVEEDSGRNGAGLGYLVSALASAASGAARRVVETWPFVEVHRRVLRGASDLASAFQGPAENLGGSVYEDQPAAESKDESGNEEVKDERAADYIHDEMLDERPGM
ncbi:hypothetical protein COL5a_011022 [Colletotrichum fioriniae]|uniref:uncharacterized protein n=1 Tax=Colletotrichum fioriniae TaxID=710243 RepID=UPI002301F298|nr:uncharacterized protein COL516b_007860 [Colletotrichum fioriniae]KAJ0301457.1 hypothetical protein COL516b_007860 [Colletotrichum fioriniae]KAJ0317657.1 hypothetical protein COL5a_011022 [Colletotrichum fioriniae]KAJ3939609.1 hypothetical protein N0V96_010392 [Colletotrichum fioriniae]